MKKVLVMLSGGIDSTLCLSLAISKYKKENVYGLCFDYGQKNIKELEACKNIANHYNINYEIMDISNLFNYKSCTLLRKSKIKIPKKTYEEQVNETGGTTTNVPYRNGIMLSICCGYAIANNIDIIYYGIHKEEGVAALLYPDCSEEFNDSMNRAIYIGSGKKVKIVAPLVEMYKTEIVKLGLSKKIPFEKTWTCYEEGSIACGKCCACIDRRKAFDMNNIQDPSKYEV